MLKKWRVRRSSPELFTPRRLRRKGPWFEANCSQKSSLPQPYPENLKRADVRLRAPGHNYGNPAQLKFGYKKRDGKLIPHEGERLIGDAIKDFRADCLTYRQIAQRMTALKILTKNGKVKWHPMMIKRIVDLM